MALEIVDIEDEERPRPSRPAMPEGFSLGRIAPRDKITERVVQLKEPGTARTVGVLRIKVYVNRLTSRPTELSDEEAAAIEGGDDAIASRKNAKWMAEWLAGWNLMGDSSVKGFVGDDEVVPIDPEMIEFVPLWVRNDIVDAAMELINPNLQRSRGSRRR